MTSIDYQIDEKEHLKIIISGTLDSNTAGTLWSKIINEVDRYEPQQLTIDVNELQYCDGIGIGLLLKLEKMQRDNNGTIKIEGLKPEFVRLKELFSIEHVSSSEPKPFFLRSSVENIGKIVLEFTGQLNKQISFTGEVFIKLFDTAFRSKKLRWKDTFVLAEKAGANAVGIIALLGFLIGLILAFQSAVGMSKFGAEVYVADLVVLVILRELGPLITAFVLAARTGSAYAAEIGTMKVNEEIDALTTMGFDPVRFLVIPRVLAATFVTPLLTMFNNLFGILGGGFVMMLMGFSPIVYLHQIQQAATLTDLLGGLVKTFVFGALIAGIGCLRGLQTGKDASSVGDSATRAVVAGIIAIVIADGIFAVIYYFLGI